MGEKLINIFGLAHSVWRNKFIFSAAVGFCTIWALVYAITATPVFTAKATLLPHRSGAEGPMASSLAMLYGGSFGGTTYEDLIEEIVVSDTILDALIGQKWKFLGEENISLFEVFGISNEDSLKADHTLRSRLRVSAIMVHRDLMTGFIAISVKMPRDPFLAAEVANAIVGKVMEFNSAFHGSHAENNRKYLKNRLVEIQEDLDASENQLANFTRNNRSYASSPDLLQRYNELRRHVEANSAAWLEVRRQLEIALLEAHKGPPAVEVLDFARPPVLRSFPKRKIIVVFGLFMGVVLGLIIVLAREYLPWGMLPRKSH